MFAEVRRAFGALDVLVNNAGVYAAMPLEAMTEEEFHREFDTNVLGPMLVIRESLRHFGPRGGSVVNIGSGASRMCPPGYSIYAASVSLAREDINPEKKDDAADRKKDEGDKSAEKPEKKD